MLEAPCGRRGHCSSQVPCPGHTSKLFALSICFIFTHAVIILLHGMMARVGVVSKAALVLPLKKAFKKSLLYKALSLPPMSNFLPFFLAFYPRPHSRCLQPSPLCVLQMTPSGPSNRGSHGAESAVMRQSAEVTKSE